MRIYFLQASFKRKRVIKDCAVKNSWRKVWNKRLNERTLCNFDEGFEINEFSNVAIRFVNRSEKTEVSRADISKGRAGTNDEPQKYWVARSIVPSLSFLIYFTVNTNYKQQSEYFFIPGGKSNLPTVWSFILIFIILWLITATSVSTFCHISGTNT